MEGAQGGVLELSILRLHWISFSKRAAVSDPFFKKNLGRGCGVLVKL